MPDLSGAKLYIAAGTLPVAKQVAAGTVWVLGPFTDVSSGGIGNDGVVPIDSVHGRDPITNALLFPQASFALFGVGHSDLPNDPNVVAQVVLWADE